jgi:hypothetical protein
MMSLASLVVTVAALVLPPQEQYVRSQYGQCPDGSVLEFAVYDPDAADASAIIVVYKRGDRVIGLLDSRTRMLTLASGVSLSLDVIRQRYATPCDLPDGAGL